MDTLVKISHRLLDRVDLSYKRYLYDEIDWAPRLIVLKGARGVGKTTLLQQYLIEHKDRETSIYLSLDHITFSERRLYDVIDDFYELGYRAFVLDEVHKYENWSIEIKNIYDSFPDVQVLLTASSATNIRSGTGDLSRRADVYTLPGLSFREYLRYQKDYEMEVIDMEILMKDHVEIAQYLSSNMDILRYFRDYLKNGYYPYYKESAARYYDRINGVVGHVLEMDLPALFGLEYKSVRQVKHLLSIVTRLAPYSPNISKVATQIEIGRSRVLQLLDHLSAAEILLLLKSAKRSDSALTKPDKIYLENTNLMHALSTMTPDTGSVRETAFYSMTRVTEEIHTPARGDFMLNQSYTIEVGGPSKDFHQVRDMPNPILAKDGIKVGKGDTIPLWLFGMLY
ncbi:MAG: AAA family ATPase [Bacteroidota bacterium]